MTASPTPSFSTIDAELTAPGQLFEVEEVEIRGSKIRTWKHAPPTYRLLLETSRFHGDKEFVVYQDERITYEEHFRRAATLARRRRAGTARRRRRCHRSPWP